MLFLFTDSCSSFYEWFLIAIRHPEPEKMTIMIARAKAAALLPKVITPSILICSDQVIRCNGEIREKPESEEEARAFLESYRTHPPECVDGVVVYNTLTGMATDSHWNMIS
jgi:septum formation protein